mmetsp:Transcript_81482/g.205050  ORF Transcript_81482/g.205050 Transcript_81482/m.205050 type:complete len:255 (+) Transcript_81482:814-1578(+)
MGIAGQRPPRPSAGCATSLERRRYPTPQNSALKQADHSDHASHSQALSPSQGPPSPVQPRASTRPSWHPLPPGCAAWMTCLLRNCWPWPQFVSHADHELHSDTWQSISLHGPSLQLSVSPRSPSQGVPPLLASTTISRVRKRCPPPQSLPHSPHCAHSPHLQSVFSGSGHEPASRIELLHGRPSPLATVMERLRIACPPSLPSQPVQSSHSPKTQSAACWPQSPSLHERMSLSVSLQGLPPPVACNMTWRDRSW